MPELFLSGYVLGYITGILLGVGTTLVFVSKVVRIHEEASFRRGVSFRERLTGQSSVPYRGSKQINTPYVAVNVSRQQYPPVKLPDETGLLHSVPYTEWNL